MSPSFHRSAHRGAHRAACLALATVAAIGLAGCRGGKTERAFVVATGGDPDRGRHVIQQRDCGSCHRIPGVRGARGLVAPPLDAFGRRTFVAGQLPNTPENLVAWISSPHAVEPGTAMPDLGLSEQEARDAAAYLYTLR